MLKFENITINPTEHVLVRDGKQVHVEPQVFDLIFCLAQNTGQLVTKDQLVEKVWNGLVVSDATINARISAARKALGDDGRKQAIIRTIHQRGFQFCLNPKKQNAVNSPNPEIRYAKSKDGTAIAWTQSGQGSKLIRLAHWLSHLTLDLDSPIWAPLIEKMQSNHNLIRYDLRGTALSQRGVSINGLELFVEDLCAVIEQAAPGPEKISLFASSQSVPVAIAFAHLKPEKLDKMVLYGGACSGRFQRGTQQDNLDMETMLSLVRSAWGQNGGVFRDAFNRLFAPDANEAQIKSICNIQQESADTETVVEMRRQIDKFNVSNLLSEIQTETLVIHAKHDAIQPFSEGQRIAAGLPNARFMMLDSRNHMMLPQDPMWSEMMDEVTQFLL